MHESGDDLARLQRLLDDSKASMGGHMAGILTDERWLSAEELADLLRGVNVLALATVTAAGAPRAGPVDGLFYRGEWHFGSSPESVRFRHIAVRPQVSAVHTRGEELAVTVHGTAERVEVAGGFRDYLVEVYGDGWSDWGSGAAYARIRAERMYTLRMPQPE